jgi:uncharacterized membrane protein YdbT with pleckstrin-like domain
VAFPEDVLSADEHVVLHLHPHWKMLVRPVLMAILAVAVTTAGFVVLPFGNAGMVGSYAIAAICLVLVGVFALWPYLVWRTTHYVFTDERVLMQHGVLSRNRRDIPLARVNDHAMNQRFAERLLGFRHPDDRVGGGAGAGGPGRHPGRRAGADNAVRPGRVAPRPPSRR